jgi:hypothetical protein
VRKIFPSWCVFFLGTALPLFAQGTSRGHEAKSPYLMYMIYLSGVLALLFVWEFVDWMMRKKAQGSMVDSVETINVVEEAPDDDPFRALLKEESAGYAASAQTKPPVESPEEPEEESGAELETIAEEEAPVPQKVEKDEKKEKSKRTIHVDIQPPPSAPEKVAQAPPSQEDKRKIKLAEPVAIDEEGWRDLMQKASQENEKKEEGHQVVVEATTAVIVDQSAVAKKTAELPRAPQEQPEEEEDPWKALLKKSKQEEESTKEVEKPWSTLLKGDKGKSSEPPLPLAEPLSIELGNGRKGDSDSSTDIEPDIRHEKKSGPSSDAQDEADEEARRAQGSDSEAKALDLKVDKKKEDSDEEKKSSSKENIPTFIKKASRVITIPSPFDKGDEKEDQRKSPGVLSTPKDDRKFITLDGSPRKAQDDEKSDD